jgi:ABC-type sugar transport system ATPase subunit
MDSAGAVSGLCEITPVETAGARAPALEAIGLTKHFGGVVALDGVSIGFPQGTITALVGDNGAGKSTLMNVLAGVHASYDGEVRLDGQRVHFGSPHDARRAGVEAVYQDLALADTLDVTANFFLGREQTYRVGIGRLVRIMRNAPMRTEARAALAELGIELPSLSVRTRNLSGGQRQAVAIARAARWSSNVIILDEPTAALGVQESGKVEELIEKLRQRGRTIILVTHRLDQVFRLGDYVAVLRRGRLVGQCKTTDTTSADLVSMITGLSTMEGERWT